MNESLFIEIVNKYFPGIKSIVEKVNGKRSVAVSYLHEEMLRKEYSPTQKWDSASVDTTYVAADIVDLDSPLPIKKRDSISQASGDLPTIGMKLWLGNKQINEINVMIAQGIITSQIAAKVFNDAVRCVNGMRERLEGCFLQALSDGVCVVPDSENNGTGIRLDFNYLPQNKYGVNVPWGENGATPVSDLARVLGDNPGITTIMIAKETYNQLRQSYEAKELVASYSGFALATGTTYPTPTPAKFNEAFLDEYGVDFKIVDRTIYIEKNGVRSKVRPWNRDKVIFLTDTNVGALVYGTLPEELQKVAGVTYSKPLEYALLSKYSTNDPLREFTAIQGIVAPILENVDQIYSLDITEGQILDKDAENRDSSDVKITIYGAVYNKSKVIEKLSSLTGSRINSKIGDDKLILKINELNDEQEALFKEQIEADKDSQSVLPGQNL